MRRIDDIEWRKCIMELIECLKKHGQRLDFEISEETGIALASVRERLAVMEKTGAVIACKVTRFEQGKPNTACLYRLAGYSPPRSAGRKPTSQAT